jgi:hypothetical protein
LQIRWVDNLNKKTPNKDSNANGDLLSLLKDHPDDEKNGINAALGFTFQQWWATLKATELFATTEDFAIGMEIKDDVIVLNSADSPTEIEFYQIKKYEREGVWSLSQLIKESKDASAYSILAKLYSRRNNLKPHPSKLAFISNIGFKVPLAEGSVKLQHSKGLQLSELATKHKQDLVERIATQLKINKEDIEIDDFQLLTTYLPIAEQEIFITGKLSELNDQGKLPFTISKPSLSARVLVTELQQKASHTDYANTIDKLKDRCLSKSEINNILSEIESSGPSTQSALESAIARLDSENFHFSKLESIKKEKVRVCANISDRTNQQVTLIAQIIQNEYNENKNSFESLSNLGEILQSLINIIESKRYTELSGVEYGYICGLSLLVIKNAISLNVLTPQTYQKS